MNTQFHQLAHDISSTQLNADQIIAKATQAVTDAKSAGVSEQQFLSELSEKMSLNMSTEEIQSSIDELKATRSQEKVRELAQNLVQNQNGDKFIQVLITFALLSLLMIGLFYIIAAPYPR
ncbi:MAG: hypothetical protein RIR26_2142 [Pseudomonadota bacterium]